MRFLETFRAANSALQGNGITEPADLPPTVTSLFPGSDDKVRLLQERLEQGYQLWHPDDLTMDKFDEENNPKAQQATKEPEWWDGGTDQ